MSVSAGINTSIRDELSCMETGNIDGNNKTSSPDNPQNEHQNGGNSDGANSDSSTKDDHETDSSTSKPSGQARISYPNDRLTDDSSLEGTDIEAEDNQRFQIQDSVLRDSSESQTSNKPSESPGNKHTEVQKSNLSITGIVQRNLGDATTNNIEKMKESVYNFDEEEEHIIPPKPAYLNHNNSASHRFSGSFPSNHVSLNTGKPATPAMVFVAKKSRPTPESEVKANKKNKTKKLKKKQEKKMPTPKESEQTEVKEIDPRILSLDTSKDLYKEGYLVWGKIRGFSYWPGIITVDPMDGLTVKFMKKNSDVPYSHVHFLGYERSQRAWLPENMIMEFKGIDHFVELGSRIPPTSPKKKDFTPKKTLLERFEKGMDLAESVLSLSFRQRLEKLDLVYVLIPSLKEKEEKERKQKPRENQPNDARDAKGAKKRRKSGEYDSENSSNSGKKKKRKKENQSSEQIPQPPASNNDELSGQELKESNISLKVEETKETPGNKLEKRKISFSNSDKKTKKIKLVTDNKQIDDGKSEASTPGKRGRKKKTENTSSINDTNEKSQKKSTKQTLNGAKETPTKSFTNGDSSKSLNTEECGSGVTVRVSSPVDDSSETEIKDISESSKQDEFDSDLDENEDGTNKSYNNEGPKLGSLVWGRLAGFPYWPCFVTKCPDTGEYRRMYDASRRCDYHVQFFNWNNESGWVRNTQPWCTLEEFQAIAKTATKRLPPTSKEFKAWRPTGKLLQKLTDAFNEAQRTSGMTRRERHNNYVVFYRSKMEQTKMTNLISEGPRAKKHRKSGSIDSRTSDTTPKERKLSTNTAISKPSMKKENKIISRPIGLMKPCPKSVQNKKKNVQRLNAKLEKDKTLPTTASRESCLPPGWSSKIVNRENNREERQFKSPEGISFSSIKEATAHLFHQNSIQNHEKLKKYKLGISSANRNKSILLKTGKRHRSYSMNEKMLPSIKARLNENGISSNSFVNDLGCDGWFLSCYSQMHYGYPESGLVDIEHKAGDLQTGRIEYIEDLSIPSSWACVKTWKYSESGSVKQKNNPSLSYVSEKTLRYNTDRKPEDDHQQKFNSKLELIQDLEGIGHPAIQLEQMLKNFVQNSQSRTEDIKETKEAIEVKKEKEEVDENNDSVDNNLDTDEDTDSHEHLFDPINLCDWSVDQARRHPILGRAVTPCYVDMVQLPGIFLQHPSVLVEESENEMVISDYFTKEFIAKKIIYD